MLDRLAEERCLESRISERKILVVVRLTQDEARFVIRDEGRGFNSANVVSDSTPDRFVSGKCRGMTLIHSMMDEVTFNKTGNELVMRKRVQRSSEGSPQDSECSLLE
jgi:anti-sigma regulatory factor (Ser/Thr protein kinase)